MGPNVEDGFLELAGGFWPTNFFIVVGLGVVFGRHKTMFLFLQVHKFKCIKCTILQPPFTPIKAHIPSFIENGREPQAAQKLFTIFVVPRSSEC